MTFQGRNAVLEAFRSGKTIDKLFILDGCQDGPIKSIVREARKTDVIINYVDKERLDRLAGTGHHQGVVAKQAHAALQKLDYGGQLFIVLLSLVHIGMRKNGVSVNYICIKCKNNKIAVTFCHIHHQMGLRDI